jgi:hypothetical protein
MNKVMLIDWAIDTFNQIIELKQLHNSYSLHDRENRKTLDYKISVAEKKLLFLLTIAEFEQINEIIESRKSETQQILSNLFDNDISFIEHFLC